VTERLVSSILADLHVRLEAGFSGSERPFVTLAYAQSLDGSIAGEGNRPLRLSCESSLTLTHELRAAHDAILVGIGTVLADNPRLNVRLVNGKDPRPVVVDSRLRMPTDALLLSGGREAIVATTEAARGELPVDCLTVLRTPALRNGWVDLDRLLLELGRRGVRHVLVEGGARILTSFLESRLADYVVVTISPRFVLGVRPLGARELRPSPRLDPFGWERVGEDLVVAGPIDWSGA
jgi:3,4-dihydroxy 2-butanone 4-phosphate synthase/GTP cyclohydrolase II